MMTTLATILPVLAVKEDLIVFAIVSILTVIGWISKLASGRQKGPPVVTRPRPPVRPRDDRLQQEISIFLDDTAGRGNRGAASRPPARPGANEPQKTTQAKRRPQGAAASAAKKKGRPGAEIASRQAPVTESLGTGVKQHLSQHMTERVSQEVQQRLAPRVEEQVAADLGTQAPGGALRPAPPGRATGASRAERYAELLRSPGGVQQAIVLNLILSLPPGRTGSHRR